MIALRPQHLAALLLACLPLGLAGCRQDMHDQPKLEPLEKSAFFDDGRASRPSVPGTIARGRLFESEHLYRGRVDGELATSFPPELPVTAELLIRGRQRYEIFCTPCHAYDGSGAGMAVRRGLRQPTSLHAQRLVDAPHGYFFDVITNGFGAMYDYADRIPAEDRWAITAYIRTLQRSQRGTLDDLTAEQRELLLSRN